MSPGIQVCWNIALHERKALSSDRYRPSNSEQKTSASRYYGKESPSHGQCGACVSHENVAAPSAFALRLRFTVGSMLAAAASGRKRGPWNFARTLLEIVWRRSAVAYQDITVGLTAGCETAVDARERLTTLSISVIASWPKKATQAQ